jgi:hypothetical protein
MINVIIDITCRILKDKNFVEYLSNSAYVIFARNNWWTVAETEELMWL